MKSKLYFFLLTALMGLSGMNASAQDPYEISTAQDLVDFAETVNGGDYGANAVLTADIDMTGVDISVFPIGGPDTGKRYVGTFDGQGHKISNFKLINPSAATNFGMFNTNTGVVLRNFWLDSTCEIEGREVVSLIGRHDGGGTFEGIGNCANVTGTNNNVGGLIGGVFGVSNNKKNVYITNCWTANKVTSTNSSASNYQDCGALAGWFNNVNVTLTNFWTIAEVVNFKSNATYIIRSGNGATFTASGCYSKYKADTQEKVTFTAITDEQVESGELCFLLNGSQSETVSWYQNLDDDAFPKPFGTDIVHLSGRLHCDGTAYDGSFYTNDDLGMVTDPHDYADGLCSYCGVPDNTYMTANGEGFFEISTPRQFQWFAAYANASDPTAKAKLVNDIDLEGVEVSIIGNSPSNAFKGTFDGQGFEITGYSLIIDGTFVANNGYGLFGNTSGATIKDFTIDGEMEFTGAGSGDFGCALVGWPDEGTLIQNIKSTIDINATVYSHIGGIVGSLRTATVDRCEFAGNLNGNASNNGVAGIAAYTNYGTITNCIFSGVIEGTGTGYYGGILGYVNNAAASVKNCLSYGDINNTNSQYTASLVARLRNIGPYSNNYCTGEKSNAGEKASDDAIVANATKVSDEQLASGEVCYLLNGDQSDIVFFQTLIDDPVPTFDNTHETVYAAGTTCPNGHPQGVIYSNTPGGAVVVKPHVYTDGFCTYCGVLDEDYIIPNFDDFLEIGTPAQLKWFAVYANQVDPASNAVLTADIDLTGVTLPSIGNSSVAYAGEFDGQGYAISNFKATSEGYGGFFGMTNGATIKNFSIGGTLTVTAGTGSGVVGWAENSTISNIQSALVIEVPKSGAHHTGGVVGSARGTNVIDRCSFSGSMTIAAGSTDNFAGVVAYVTHSSTTLFDAVTNCANYGDITFSDAGCAAGGVLGYINSANAIVNNCLNTGSITFNGEGSPTFGGAILGRTKNSKFTKITNNFWLEGSANGASKKDDGSDPLATGSVTAEQLESGEVAYKLGEAWSQIIGTDEVPVLGTDAPVFYVGEAGYATLYDATTGYEFKGDVEAYVATLNPEYSNLILTKIEKVPAGTPVILKGTYFNKTAAKLPAINIANDLQGTAVDTEADGTMYVLAKPAEKEVGFYKATGTIPAGKAYFQSNAGVKAFFFASDATGIEETLSNSPLKGENVYNLAGQRMSKMQKGINIVDGKKILK